MTTNARTWLTRQAFDELQQELDHLLANPAAGAEPGSTTDEFDQEVVISADHRVARIRQIQEIFGHAVVLTVRFDDTGETTTFLLSVRHASAATLLRAVPYGRHGGPYT